MTELEIKVNSKDGNTKTLKINTESICKLIKSFELDNETVDYINKRLKQQTNNVKSAVKTFKNITDLKTVYFPVTSIKNEMKLQSDGRYEKPYKIVKESQEESQFKDMITGIKIGPLSIYCQLQNMKKIYVIELTDMIINGQLTNIKLQIREDDFPNYMINEYIDYIKKCAIENDWNEVISMIYDLQALL